MNGKQAKRLRWKAGYSRIDQPIVRYYAKSSAPVALMNNCCRYTYQVLKKGYKIRVKP